MVVSFATRAPLPAQRSVRLCRLTCIEQCVRALEISNSLRCPVAVAGHAGPPALPPPDRPFHTMYLLPCAEVDTCGALSNALAQRAVHAHASDCVRAIFASYVISTCAQGKTHACVREVALPGATCSSTPLSRRVPPAQLMSCLHALELALEFTLWRQSRSPRPPTLRLGARTYCSLVCNSYMPLPGVCSGTFCCMSITSASAFCIATTPRVGEPRTLFMHSSSGYRGVRCVCVCVRERDHVFIFSASAQRVNNHCHNLTHR